MTLNLSTRVLKSGELTVQFSALRSLRIGPRGRPWRSRFLRDELLLATLAAEFVDVFDAHLRESNTLVHDLICSANLVSEQDGVKRGQEIRLMVNVETPDAQCVIESIAHDALGHCVILESLLRGGSYRASVSVQCCTAADKIPLF